MSEVRITDQDVQSLAEKLAAFTRTLSPGELAAFELLEEQLLATTESDGADVQGFHFGSLDALGADERRQDMLREARQSVHAGRGSLWQALLSSLSAGGRAEQAIRDTPISG
jgi:hypothetical protein